MPVSRGDVEVAPEQGDLSGFPAHELRIALAPRSAYILRGPARWAGRDTGRGWRRVGECVSVV